MSSRLLRRALAAPALALVMSLVAASEARAHCDTMDGPVVVAALRSLESGDPRHALIWVRAQDEPEIREAFARTLTVRALGGDAKALADRHFLETLVRAHRLGEGEPYTGLKPAGVDHGPAIPAADRALASGSSRDVEELLASAVRDGVRRRFERASAAKAFAADDVAAGREYVAAYVELLHYVAGVHAAAGAGEHAHAVGSGTSRGHEEH